MELDGTNPTDILDALSSQLQSARTRSPDSPTHTRCPENLDQLIGVQQSDLLRRLGKPDFEENGKWAYFFSPPLPAGQMGGGFPIVEFNWNQSNSVISVSCSYAR